MESLTIAMEAGSGRREVFSSDQHVELGGGSTLECTALGRGSPLTVLYSLGSPGDR